MKKPLRSPLFQQVAEILGQEIKALPPGTRLETDQGLSRRFGVSVSVVREAVSILHRDGLLHRHVGRGTFVAEPAPRSFKPIAILCDLDLLQTPGTSFFKRIQESKVLLERQGYETAIYLGDYASSAIPPPGLTCRQFLKDLDRDKIGGVLAVWAFPNEEWVSTLREREIPLVGFGLLYEKMVSYDFEAFIRIALEALKARNRTKIAYIASVSEWNLDDFDRERRKLVMNLFREAGIEVREHWFKQDWHRTVQGGGWSQFREVWTHDSDRPDGVILSTPRFWEDIRSAIASFNLEISRDLDVVLPKESTTQGFGAIQVPFNLSTMISEAVDLLIDLLIGKASPVTRRLVNAWERPLPEVTVSALPHSASSI